MVVLQKVLVKERGTIAVLAVVIFAIFLIWVAIGMPSFVPTWFALLFLAMPVLFILIALAKGTGIFTDNKKVSALFEGSEVSGSVITFPEELEYETGRVLLEGYWVSTGRSRSYRVKRKFEARELGKGLSLEFFNEKFRVLVLKDGTGTVEAPAVRILGEPYRDVLLIFLTDEGEIKGESTINLSRGGDIARVTFRGEGKQIAGTVQSGLSKARKVRIKVGSEKVWKKIAEGQNFNFAFSPLPEEKTVIFASYRTVSPLSLIRGLWKDSVVLGHGTFGLKAVLDVPLARDVVETADFTVELGNGGEEKESEEDWGLWD
ncbi:hypothetical protein [Thermococcus sp.]|uniref:hypothetical protein n=1 Tax=Thermococcus sp. TaxID=35749 RepID=UPI0025D109B8|nr:hypothetical protein [Thermococcus sp.]